MKYLALALLTLGGILLAGCGGPTPQPAAPVTQANSKLPAEAGGQQLSHP